MKFAHMADVHIGGWREPKLRETCTQAFCKAVDMCITERVNFILISGDLFNTSMPPIDQLRTVVLKLRELQQAQIPVYSIPGSHDFSASGKTMLDVLASAGLMTNVATGEYHNEKLRLNTIHDPKTGIHITGMIGKKGGLEKMYYPYLDYEHLNAIPSPKIFLFHSAITELKPEDLSMIDALPASFLPPGFDYYAGGHVHVVDHANLDMRNNIVFPGPLFPNNFSELEKLRHGGFYLVENWKPTYTPVILYPTTPITINCHHKKPIDIPNLIKDELKSLDCTNHIITIRFEGTIKGKIGDIPFTIITDTLYSAGVYLVLKNTTKLVSPEFEQVSVQTGTLDQIEERVIVENTGKSNLFTHKEEQTVVKNLLHTLDTEKHEGETQTRFEQRILETCKDFI
ncbi:MAG: DNA repair exonuclease [Nanoarchaeota archaeon]